jgi:hypothetical protein
MREGGFSGIIVELVRVSMCPSSVGMVWSVSLHAPPLSPHRIHECVCVCVCVKPWWNWGSENLPLIRARDKPSQLNITQHKTKLYFFVPPNADARGTEVTR